MITRAYIVGVVLWGEYRDTGGMIEERCVDLMFCLCLKEFEEMIGEIMCFAEERKENRNQLKDIITALKDSMK